MNRRFRSCLHNPSYHLLRALLISSIPIITLFCSQIFITLMNFCPLKIDRLLKKKFFISQSASIYGGVSGLYDYGPYGTLLKSNIIAKWREFFVDEEDMYEIDACILTPFDVLKASGHVDKFADLLLFDKVNGECYRADHFLEHELGKLEKTDKISNILNNLENLSPEEIDMVCQDYSLKSEHGNEVGNCTQFNLIFKTCIGPKSQNVSFLRPETAQSQFVNFKKLYDLNNEKLPFASASVGKVFRNEISPRSGLLRVREFEQAEIEYYTHPDEKNMEKFYELPSITLSLLFSSLDENQKVHRINLIDAVKSKIIDNESLGYFIGRTYLFLIEIGIKDEYLRFRQHKKNEMAHYACDCWDAEIKTSYGWIECVGIADRGCYDLSVHQKCSGVSLSAQRRLKEPRIIEKYALNYNKKEIAKRLQKKMKEFIEHVNNISQEEIIQNLNEQNQLQIVFESEKYLLTAEKVVEKVFVENFVPGVIEPSFGIGRILYSLIEHSFYTRENDENRNVLGFTPSIAPVKCVIGSIINGKDYEQIITKIKGDLMRYNVRSKACFRNVSPGKKYSSWDEIGVPFFVTIDQLSLSDNQATIRERDSMKQVRMDIDKIAKFVAEKIHSNNLKLE